MRSARGGATAAPRAARARRAPPEPRARRAHSGHECIQLSHARALHRWKGISEERKANYNAKAAELKAAVAEAVAAAEAAALKQHRCETAAEWKKLLSEQQEAEAARAAAVQSEAAAKKIAEDAMDELTKLTLVKLELEQTIERLTPQ